MAQSWKNTALKGEALYHLKIKKLLGPLARGKFAAIDVKSQEFFMGDTLIEAFQKAKKKYPQHKFHFVRIGFPAAVSYKHQMRP